MFAVVVVSVLLVVLLAPSCGVLIFLNRFTFDQSVRAAWHIWVTQVVVSIALIFLADRLGLLNPLGYMLGICVLVGFAGALFLWLKNRIDRG